MSLFQAVLGGVVNQGISAASSFVMAGAAQKVTEGATKIANTLGIGSQFTKLGAALPTVEQLTSKAFRAGTSELTSNPFIQQQIQMMKESYETSASAASISAATGGSVDMSNHKVTLNDGSREVIFEVMPEIVESRSVQYDAVQPVQAPGAFQKYRGTDSVQWTLNVTFISRTSDEATTNLEYLNLLRGWTMPFFGENTGIVYPEKLGAPPPVLTLKGLRERIIGPVPVVITALNWNWPRDVDYIPTNISDAANSGQIPFPTVMTIAIQLTESYSTAQMNNFSLSDYKNGEIEVAFNSTITR